MSVRSTAAIASLAPSIVPGPFGLLQPVTTRQVYPEQNLSDGTSQNMTYRSRHPIQVATPYVQLVWINAGTPTLPSNAVTYKSSVDIVPVAAQSAGNLNSVPVTPVTLMGGQVNWTAQPGGMVVSDPIWGPFNPGDWILVRTNVQTATSGQKWPVGMTLNWTYEGASAGDQTAAPNYAYSPPATGPGVSPCLILSPVNGKVSVVGIGNSIMDGAGDSGSGPYNNLGPLSRALDGSGIGYFKLGAPGERVASVVTAPSGYAYRGALALQAKNVVCEYGTNDLGNGDPLATIQANLIQFWKPFALAGRRVFHTTMLPRTTGTFPTISGQSLTSFESVRVALNNWLRAGAPVNSSNVPVAIGTASAIVAGQPGHFLTGIFDWCSAIEVNSAGVQTVNGGYWPPNWTADGTHPTAVASIAAGATISISAFKQ